MHRMPDPLASSPRCGARTRAGGTCQSPAMPNGRCRMHGGPSTGPRTPEGLKRMREAKISHGRYTREHLERLIRIRQLQEEGVPLADIPGRLDGRPAASSARQGHAALAATSWARMRIAEDVELHVRTDRKGPWLLDDLDGGAGIDRVSGIDGAVVPAHLDGLGAQA